MGADIHFVIEKKNKEADEWVGIYSTENAFKQQTYDRGDAVATPIGRLKERDYDFFGRLASVRREGPAPLGFPPDASSLARMGVSDNDSDLHSHTHMTLREFITRKLAADGVVAAAASRLKGNDIVVQYLGQEFLSWDDDSEDNGLLGPNTRVVIAFDN